MAVDLVVKYGESAGERLGRRLNPMFELIAGQIFHHGGSVIRFLGDGFTAWFDDTHRPTAETSPRPLPGVLRAVVAGMGIQEVMHIYKELRHKICVGVGEADRWVVGMPSYGLNDVLSGEAVSRMISLSGEAQPEQVMVHRDALPTLRAAHIGLEITDTGNALITAVPRAIQDSARAYRWMPYDAGDDLSGALERIAPFVDAALRERIESGIGNFSDELRHAIPMFIQVEVSSNALNPQAALNHYVCGVQEKIAVFGGRLMSVEVSDKGSVLFVVFGAPITYGDDAERALRFAMTLREMTAGLPNIAAQNIGVSRGLLFAGIVGGEMRHEYSTIGDETNIAARLMTAAQEGQILVTSAVRKTAGGRIVFRELPSISVKGRGEPIPIYEPIASRAAPTHEILGAFVGREGQIAALRRAASAVMSGYARAFSIEGIEGIGKSRLIRETAQMLSGFRLVMGECLSTGQDTPYMAWGTILYALFDLGSDLPPERAAAAITEQVKRVYPDGVGRLPFLGDVLQLPFEETETTAQLDGLTRREAVFALITEMVIALAKVAPLFLVIEDMQWIDEVSALLAVDLVRRLSVDAAPILLCLTFRPLASNEDVSQHLLQALTETHFYTALTLHEFDLGDLHAFVEAHLDSLTPPDLSTFLYERTQGNPLFARELMDALIESGYIKQQGDAVVIIRDLSQARLPLSIRELVQARIDRLSDLDRLILKVAAVIGRDFSMRILHESVPVPIPETELMQRLNTLETQEFAYLISADPDPVYRFRHAITQEVAYEGLLGEQRAMLHQAVAVAMRIYQPEAHELLAHHFSHGRNSDEAWVYLVLAGEKAFRDYANGSALKYYGQALDISKDDEERFEILQRLIVIYLRVGDMTDAFERLTTLGFLADEAGEPSWIAAAHLLRGQYYAQTSAFPDAFREAQQTITLAESLNDDSLAWEGYMLMRTALLSLNQRDRVVRSNLDLKMQRLADRLRDPRHTIGLLLTQFDDMYAEDPEQAIQGAHIALMRAEQEGNPLLVADCYAVLVDLYVRQSDLAATYEAAERQREQLHQIGDRRREGLTMNRLGYLLLELGQMTAANQMLQDAYQILHQIGERAGKAANLMNLGLIAESRGALEEGLAYINRALLAQRELNATVEGTLTLFFQGNILLAKGNLDEAANAFETAVGILEITPRVRHPLTRVEIESGLGAVDMARGHYATAHARLSPLILRLGRRQISGLCRPTLAYQRALTTLLKVGDTERASLLKTACRNAFIPLRSWLRGRGWERGWLTTIPHHRELFGEGS